MRRGTVGGWARLEIEPLHEDFAARVSGVALDSDIPEGAPAEVRAPPVEVGSFGLRPL